jgi:hypothetical protein
VKKIYNLCGKDENFTSLAESKKWLYILAQTKELPNITNLISFILSIPCTTAYVERIFSIMTNKWTDTRNRASTELIKSELCISLNFDMSCLEFYNYALGDQKLLSESQNEKKVPLALSVDFYLKCFFFIYIIVSLSMLFSFVCL